MSKVNKSAAFKALNKFATAREQLIQGLHDAGYTVESSRDVVIEWACERMGHGLEADVPACRQSASGKFLLVSSHAHYEALKTVVRDVMHMLAGTTRRAASGSKERDPVADALKALSKLTPAQLKKVLAAL